MRQSILRTPLRFEANQSQTDSHVDYLARGPGYTLFLTATEAVLTLRHDKPVTAAVVRMQLLGGNPGARATGVDRLPGNVNYFKGNDPSKWQTHVLTFSKVQYQIVYPGIGLVYYGNPQQLEYDFHVGPGADPAQIRLAFAGAQSIRVDAGGDLVVQADGPELRQHRPVAYQEIAGRRRKVTADFVVQGNEVGFALAGYDGSQPLVIDPVLSYSTYVGGSGADYGAAIAVDAAGNAYVTVSRPRPTSPQFMPSRPGWAGPTGPPRTHS